VGCTVAAYGLAFLIVTKGSEAGAWEMANLGIAAGVVVPSWSWGRAGLLWPWLLGLAFKVAVLARWGWGWWSPIRSRLHVVSSTLGIWGAPFYFFWWAPVFVCVVTLIEALLIKRALDLIAANGTTSPRGGRSRF